MHHKTHIGLIYAHAKGDSGHNRVVLAAQKSRLHIFASGTGHPRVVRHDREMRRQLFRLLLGRLARGRVDDCRPSRPILQQLDQRRHQQRDLDDVCRRRRQSLELPSQVRAGPEPCKNACFFVLREITR